MTTSFFDLAPQRTRKLVDDQQEDGSASGPQQQQHGGALSIDLTPSQ